MFYLFLFINFYFSFSLYKRYFKINLLILIGYLIFNSFAVAYFYYNSIIDSIIFYYILVLLYLSFIIDLKEMWISDFTIIGIFLLNIFKVIIDYFIFNQKVIYDGTIFIFLVIVICLIAESILKKELMGFGDLKLYFVLSFNYSFTKVVYLIMLSSLIGIIYYFLFKKKKEFPFGPSIIIAYIILEITKKLVG